MTEVEVRDDSTVYCLNCGTECNDKFCPHCGQSVAVPSKLKMKNFGKSVLMSFGRLTPGFFITAKGLLLHPWTVIQDHIHGKHVKYSPPVTMVIQVFLYSTILYTCIDAIFGTKLMEIYNFNSGIFNLYLNEDINPLLVMLDQSIVIESIFFAIPFCFIVYIAYYRHGSRRFNFAEYLVAFVYMFAAITMYDVIFNLLYLIPGIKFEVSVITLLVISVFSVIMLIKAFPQDKWWKHVLLLMWFGFLSFIAVMLIAMLAALVIVIASYFNLNLT